MSALNLWVANLQFKLQPESGKAPYNGPTSRNPPIAHMMR